MAIAGVLMKAESARHEDLKRELEKFSGVSWQQDTPEGDMILLVEAANLKALHKICQKLEKLDGALGVYPSYVTTADEQ
ncbi:MAG: chaperone NapD [Quinella sp. 3Q1]|nr:chaperone NapD [Quinella sp. 3Q1]MBR3051796.1 chaperone NapD [Selenomonadaceae bacterium]MBR6887292.1 chaperone NapD [Selenomonadaceae bacterium]